MIDISTHIGAIQREVSRRPAESGELVSVVIRRDYRASADDVWDAVTNPDRIRRWFMPISGDLREGGDFQLEGNAGGRILQCEPPRFLKVTFGGETSIVELRVQSTGPDAAVLQLEHTVPIEIAQSGAGALFVGPGWDGAFLGLGLYFAGEAPADPVAAASSPEAQEFSRHSVDAWRAAVEASGTATAEEIAAAVEMSMAQFAPDAGNGRPA